MIINLENWVGGNVVVGRLDRNFSVLLSAAGVQKRGVLAPREKSGDKERRTLR